MRVRAAVVAVVSLLLPVVPLAGAEAAAEIYTAFTVDAPPGDGIFTTSEQRSGPTNVAGTGDASQVVVTASSWSATLTPPSGESLAPGEWVTAKAAGPGGIAGLDVRSGSLQCTESSGSLTIHEVTFGEGGALATLAASYSQACTGPGGEVHGELRIASELPYRAVRMTPSAMGAGPYVVGRQTAGPTFSFENIGGAPVTLAPGFAGPNAADWSVATDTCSAGPLAPGATCAVAVRVVPGAAGERVADFVATDDTRRGSRSGRMTISAVRALLVFVEYDETGVSLLLADHTGARIRQIFKSTTADILLPRLSPDGTEVAYVSDPAAGDYQVFVRPVLGGSARQLTTGPFSHAYPSWSPDGTRVLYSRYDENRDLNDAYSVPAAGGTPTLHATGATAPSYSPSGRQIAVENDNGGIDVVTLATRSRVTVPGAAGFTPSWSPDGSKLAYIEWAGGPTTKLRLIDPAGGAPQNVLSAGLGFDVYPSWSTDGSELYFTRFTDVGGELRRVASDSTVSELIPQPGSIDVEMVSAYAAPPVAETTPPAAPVLSGAINSGTVKLSWPAVPGATEYVVRRGNAGEPAPATPTSGIRVYNGGARSATATGLTNRSTYGFSVFALDPSGNAAGATRLATPLPAPVVRPPALVPLLSATAQWTVRWGLTGASSYEVQRGLKQRGSTGSWSAPQYKGWSVPPTNTAATMTGLPGNTYWYRVRARDAYGNVTPWSSSKPSSVALDEDYYAIGASSGWTSASGSKYWLGSIRSATAAGRTLTYTAETAGFNVIGERCPTCGQVRVYVDGVLRATVDTRGNGTPYRQNLWSISLSGGIKRHTIRLETVGTAGRPRVAIDGIGLYR